jgi:hypothetical protein
MKLYEPEHLEHLLKDRSLRVLKELCSLETSDFLDNLAAARLAVILATRLEMAKFLGSLTGFFIVSGAIEG